MSDILEINNLKKHFTLSREGLFSPRPVLKAVDGVSFGIKKGTIMGLVGESGCGKSTLGQTAIRLQEPTSGGVKFHGKNIYSMSQREVREIPSHHRRVGVMTN